MIWILLRSTRETATRYVTGVGPGLGGPGSIATSLREGDLSLHTTLPESNKSIVWRGY